MVIGLWGPMLAIVSHLIESRVSFSVPWYVMIDQDRRLISTQI